MKKSRVWQAIVPGTQNKPQDTLQIRKTPWHGVTKQPPSLCPGQRVWQAIVPGTQNKPQDTLQIRETSCGLFCVPGTIACQTLDFFIRFRSDVWPGQRDSRRLFRHAVPGCFPDLKGVLWLVLCAWNNCLPDPLARAEGRRLFRHAVPGCFPDLKGVLWLFLLAWNICLPDPFSFGPGVTFGPGRGTAGGCFVTPCQGVSLI